MRCGVSPKYANSLTWKSLIKSLPGNIYLDRNSCHHDPNPRGGVKYPVGEASFGVQPREPGDMRSVSFPSKEPSPLLPPPPLIKSISTCL